MLDPVPPETRIWPDLLATYFSPISDLYVFGTLFPLSFYFACRPAFSLSS